MCLRCGAGGLRLRAGFDVCCVGLRWGLGGVCFSLMWWVCVGVCVHGCVLWLGVRGCGYWVVVGCL